jgi:hypothetical protein
MGLVKQKIVKPTERGFEQPWRTRILLDGARPYAKSPNARMPPHRW